MSDLVTLPCGCMMINSVYFAHSAGCDNHCMDDTPAEKYKPGIASREGLYPWVLIDDEHRTLDFVVTDSSGRQIKPNSPYWYPFDGTREDLADTIAHTQEKMWFTIAHRDALFEVWLDLIGEENHAIKSLTHHQPYDEVYHRIISE